MLTQWSSFCGTTLPGQQLPDDIELLLTRQWPQRRREVNGILLGDESKEVCQLQHPICPVDLMHAVGDVRRNVDQTGEIDFVTHRLQALRDFESDNTTI